MEVLDEKQRKAYALFLLGLFLALVLFLVACQFPLGSVTKFTDRDGNVLEIKTTLDLKE